MNPDLLDLAGGDTYRARAVHRLLTALACGPDPVLREMAAGVLRGDLSVRDAAAGQVYGDALADRFDTFWRHHQNLTADEHRALLAEGHRFIEQAEGHRFIEQPETAPPGASTD
ncbi:hypothetical protein [Jidongwangia harbinensis]|uniref:hypothetical protein n=1 Tax=Jidongwangia harbinensis TaxID=2878561 RepID=UPI001CD9AE8A|nr:hypothetical protein [Jidongwangia harbinensis]MCA2213922.1 hypothetical protein [Jidongwangia harbinensis]